MIPIIIGTFYLLAVIAFCLALYCYVSGRTVPAITGWYRLGVWMHQPSKRSMLTTLGGRVVFWTVAASSFSLSVFVILLDGYGILPMSSTIVNIFASLAVVSGVYTICKYA